LIQRSGYRVGAVPALRVIIARQNEAEVNHLETSQQNRRPLAVCFRLRPISGLPWNAPCPIDGGTLTPGEAQNLVTDGNARYVAGQ